MAIEVTVAVEKKVTVTLVADVEVWRDVLPVLRHAIDPSINWTTLQKSTLTTIVLAVEAQLRAVGEKPY